MDDPFTTRASRQRAFPRFRMKLDKFLFQTLRNNNRWKLEFRRLAHKTRQVAAVDVL
jgi:hypothetical protein